MEQKLTATFLRNLFLGLAFAGLSGSVLAFTQNKDNFLFSYLTAFTFGLSIALGGLFFVLIQHLTRAGWSVTVRRLAEHISGTLRWYWVLVLPLVFFGIHTLFHWSHAEAVSSDPILQSKAAYLNVPFFLIRTAIFFGGWVLLSHYFLKDSVAQDTDGNKSRTLRMQKVATVGAMFYAVSETFFAFDWMMSLSAHWFSTVYGLYYFACQVVAVLSVLVLLVLYIHSTGKLTKEVNVEHMHDLGKLLFGFNVFWAYIAFSQWMLIWYANLGEETPFYHLRIQGSWKTMGYTLIFAHFVIPFLLLLSRNMKRSPLMLGIGATIILASNYLDLYWLIMPNFHTKTVVFTMGDASTLLLIVGVFGYGLLKSISTTSLYPLKDPRLQESLHHSN